MKFSVGRCCTKSARSRIMYSLYGRREPTCHRVNTIHLDKSAYPQCFLCMNQQIELQFRKCGMMDDSHKMFSDANEIYCQAKIGL